MRSLDLSLPRIALDPASGPLYRQVYESYRIAILEGRLTPGQRIPSTRALALELGISRLPVLTAFEQLLHEGYLEGRVGSGTYVAAAIMDRIKDRNGARPSKRQTQSSPRARRQADATVQASSPRNDFGAFRVSLPALDQFPREEWARLVSRHARRMTIASMAYGDAAGHLPLRRAIAEHLRASRGVVCDADQILIVSGSQMALQLCARVLLQPGDTFCFEEPGYPGARDALRSTGALLRPIPVDADGMTTRSLDAGKQTARAAYVTPSHQYPLGVSMNAARRLELIEWARRCESWIIEDDYDSDYRYASRPLGSLQGMDHASRVVYIGTFSKVLFPALRIGYVVAPASLVDRFIAHRRALDLFPSMLHQLALTDFIGEGRFARHIRKMRGVYMKRRDALVEALERRLGDTLSIVNAEAGMHLSAWLPPGTDDNEIVRRAAARGISAIALSTCYAGKPSKAGLVLGFGGASEPALRKATELLAHVIEEVRQETA